MRKKLKGLPPAKKKRYFMPSKIFAWHSLSLRSSGTRISDDEESGSVGFIPVYPTRELAEKACPDDPIIEMESML